MKKLLPILIFIGLSLSFKAYATSFTSSQTGDWSSSSTWGGAGVPGAGDIATISDGTTVTVSDTRTVGSNVSNIGNAVRVHGTNSTTFGTLHISATGNLTVRGNDIFDLMMSVDQYAHVNNDSGAVLHEDLTSDAQSYISNSGIINGTGLTINGNANWNTSGSVNLSSVPSYDPVRNLVATDLGNIFISNASGTAIGVFGDSSISIGSLSPSNVFNTEVANITQVTSQGKYFVDYVNGSIFAYSTSSVSSISGTISYKYLVTIGSAIKSVGNTDYNEFTCDHCTFNYIGSRGGDSYQAFVVDNKRTPSFGGTSRNFSITNSTFNYVNRPIWLGAVNGTVSDPILINGNSWKWYGDNGGVSGQGITIGGKNTSYVSIQNNFVYGHTFLWVTRDLSQTYTNTGWVVANNPGHVTEFFDGEPNIALFPDSIMKNNALVGYSSFSNSRMIADFGGSSGYTATTTGNVIEFPNRSMNYVAYSDLNNNVTLYSPHHGVSGPVNGFGNSFVKNVTYEHNIVAQGSCEDGGGFEYGYNYHYFYDNVAVINNTFDSCAGAHGALSFADNLDLFGMVSALSHANDYNNLIANNVTGVEAKVDGSQSLGRLGLDVNDYNDLYNNTSNYVHFNQFSTFTDSSGNYNTDTLKNILGVSLFNPNYSSTTSKSLVMAYPSANQPSLAWDGGTAIALRSYNGTTSSATQAVINGTLVDNSQSWPTDFTNSTTPVGMWIKIISGTDAGDVQRIVDDTATSVTVSMPWAVTPDSTSVYGIYKSVVTLKDSGGTNSVDAGIDMRTLPTTVKTDTGISFNVRSLNVNPSFTDNTRTIMSWNVTQGGTADEWAAMARLAATPSLIGSSLLPYLQTGWLPTNTALKGAGFNGLDIGAIPFLQISYHAVGRENGKLIYF